MAADEVSLKAQLNNVATRHDLPTHAVAALLLILDDAYDRGFKDALYLYAWHHPDGGLRCGTTGTTYQDAVQNRREAFNYTPASESR